MPRTRRGGGDEQGEGEDGEALDSHAGLYSPHPPRRHHELLRYRRHVREGRRVGPCHPHLHAEVVEDLEQRRPPTRIEVRGDLVEQDDGGKSRHCGDEPRMGEHKTDEKRLLLARRGPPRLDVLGAVPNQEVGRLRTDEGAPGGPVARAASAQPVAVEILDVDGGASRELCLERAFEREGGPREGRRGAGPRRDNCCEAVHRLAPCGGHGDAGLGNLPFDRVQPSRVGTLVLEQAISRPQGTLKRVDTRSVSGVHRQHETVEEAPSIAGRSGEKAVQRRREPDEADVVGECGWRGYGRPVDSTSPRRATVTFHALHAGAEATAVAGETDRD